MLTVNYVRMVTRYNTTIAQCHCPFFVKLTTPIKGNNRILLCQHKLFSQNTHKKVPQSLLFFFVFFPYKFCTVSKKAYTHFCTTHWQCLHCLESTIGKTRPTTLTLIDII